MRQRVNRAEFLGWVIRGGFLAGLLGLGAAALHGKKSVSECFNEQHCASCWAYIDCERPDKREAAP